jgi:NAD-dependent deacetylase
MTQLKTLPKIVVLTGAGISAESGLQTFRDNNGLWENHSVEDVATPQAFENNPELVYRFYNARRAQLQDNQVSANKAHHALATLEQLLDVVSQTKHLNGLNHLMVIRRVLAVAIKP